MKAYDRRHRTTTNGFTFIEMIITVGVLALISAMSAQVFFTTTRNATKADVLRTIKQNGDLATEVMIRMIQNAQFVTSVCDGSETQMLTIENLDGGTTTFESVSDGSAMRIASVSAQGTAYLTTGTITLEDPSCPDSMLRIRCSSSTGVPAQVQINFALSQIGQQGNQSEQACVPFQATATIRNQ